MKPTSLCLNRGVSFAELVLALWLGPSGGQAPAFQPIQWRRHSPGIGSLTQIAHGNDLWIACGTDGVAFSSDAQLWERVRDRMLKPTQGAVHYGGGLWVVVGRGGFLATSPDGQDWIAHDLGVPASGLASVAYGNGTWVAVGASGDRVPDGDHAAVHSSIDGRSWTRQTIAGVGALTGVYHANGTWVAVGQGGFATSSDGRTWLSHQPGAEESRTYAAAYGSGNWLVLDSHRPPSGKERLRLWHSSDSWTWTSSEPEPATLPCIELGGGSVHHANGTWLLGLNYTEQDGTPAEPAGRKVVGRLWSSSDGRVWTLVYTGGRVNDVCYGDGLWVSVGEAILASPDLRNWQAYEPPGDLEFSNVRFAAGTWVAMARSPASAVYVARPPKAPRAEMAIQRKPDGSGLEASCLGPRDHVYRLQRSDDLRGWTDLAVTHQNLSAYVMPHSRVREFYRTVVSPMTGDDDWKNQITAAGTNGSSGEPFLSRPGDGSSEGFRWVKFLILLDDPDRVYFQDSSKYVFHYAFARTRLPGFAGLSVEEFDAIALHRDGQQIVLGALIFPPDPLRAEIGIQFAGYDTFTPGQIAEWFHRVRSRVVIPGVTFYYLPVFEQALNADASAAELAARGVAVASLDRWVAGDQCYSRGWALGRLVYLPSMEITAAHADGRLLPSDILLTDAVPAEIPPVIGLLGLAPTAPNSHVAILAQSSGVPFGYVADPAEKSRLLGWNGDEVLLMVYPAARGGVIKAFKASDRLSSDHRRQLLELNQPAPLEITPMASAGRIAIPSADLVPADIRYVGGKAANFGVLARAIPENAPAGAIAFTFDLWRAFLQQELVQGGTLQRWIDEKLSVFANPPANPAGLNDALAEVRQRITHDADFTAEQKREILLTLSTFDPRRNLRFRSSTNVEDSETFTGAGLYDSYSGCLADDLDGDERGPSHCDPTESNERSVLRALRKVYASFYNANAYLERRRRGVDEEEAGMGVLVHESAPDEIEWANGVGTLTVTHAQDPATRSVSARLVTQKGPMSVANPEAGARPEIVGAAWSGQATPALAFEQQSALVQLGARILAWPGDYETLLGLLDAGARAYAAWFPAKQKLVLDFEYKRLAPGKLSVKQIREIPASGQSAPLLIPDVDDVVVLQYSNRERFADGPIPMDVMANHRLKGSWRFGMSRLDLGLVAEATFREGDAVQTVAGPMGNLPEARVQVDHNRVQYAFVRGEGMSRRTTRLNLVFPWDLESDLLPLVFLSDAVIDLRVDYDVARPWFEADGTPTLRSSEMALLEPREALNRGTTPVILGVSAGPLRIESEYNYWNLYSRPDGYRGEHLTEALAGFRETRIIGLASRPITLRSDFAQSFATYRHNFAQSFLFEPGMEPGLDPEILAELRATNVKMLWVSCGCILMGVDPDDINGEIVCQGCDRIRGLPSPWHGVWRVRGVGYDGTLREW